MTGLFRQSTFGRLGGYEDVNDADRLGHDPAMRWIVGGHAVTKRAASASQMGRFETEFLAADDNIAVLADLSGRWIERVHNRRPPKKVVLDMDSSVSPTHGEQEGTAYNGPFGCTCYHPLFLFNQSAIWSAPPSVPATCTSRTDGATCWFRWSIATRNGRSD